MSSYYLVCDDRNSESSGSDCSACGWRTISLPNRAFISKAALKVW